MSGGVKQTATPAITNAPSRKRKRPRWQRSLIAACAAILLLVGGKLVDEALSQVAPQFLDHLPDFLNAIRTAPLWAQTIGLLGIGVLAFGVTWLILADRQQKRTEEAEHAEQDRAEQGKLLDAHVGEPITAAIREGFQELKHQPPPAPPAKVSAPSGLPRAVIFVGREQTLSNLMADLRAGGAVGVFALAGMGGVGKTALAAEAVARLVEAQAFPAGAAWIACDGLQGKEGLAEVWTRVAHALDAADKAVLPDAEQRRSALHTLLAQRERLLLALDNVDGLDPNSLLATLAVQGHTTLLLTARQMIDLPGLVSLSLDTLSAQDAQALFLQTLRRTSAREPRPMAEDLAALPGLVADLGGLPLAIELTATYAGRLGLALATVQQEITADGVEAAPFLPVHHPQQRALVLRFDRSWQALAETPHRQRLFSALSLLKGDSFPRAAALALALEAGGKQATKASAASDLATLVDYALVETLGSERYRLHPLLRDYAGKRLEVDHAAARDKLGEVMVAFWLEYAESYPGHVGWHPLRAESPGLMGALTWALDHARHHEVLALTKALDTLAPSARTLLLFKTWETKAAAALGDLSWQHYTTCARAEISVEMGQLEQARQSYEQALAIARQMRNLADEQRNLHTLAVLDRQTGRLAEAQGTYERALELARQLDDSAAERRELHSLAMLNNQMGQGDEALRYFEQALKVARQLLTSAAEAEELQNLGFFLCNHGEPARGRSMIEQSMKISERTIDLYNIGKCHVFLGRIDTLMGNMAAAIGHFREALHRFEQVRSLDAEEMQTALRELGAQA